MDGRACFELLIRDLAVSFTASYPSAEQDHFDDLWIACLPLLGQPRFVTRGPKAPAPILGLPFFDKRRLHITTPQTILTVAAVLYELQDLEPSPTREQLEAAVIACARALGAAELHAHQLAAHLAPALLHMISGDSPELQGALKYAAECRTRTSADTSTVELEWLQEGAFRKQPRTTSSQADSIITAYPFDLIINELAHTIAVRRDPELEFTPIRDLAPMVRAPLWLTLTRIDRKEPGFELTDLDVLRRVSPSKKRFAQDPNALEQYVSACRRFLGPALASKVFPKRQYGSYIAETNGWSYCWVRSGPREESELLLGLKRP